MADKSQLHRVVKWEPAAEIVLSWTGSDCGEESHRKPAETDCHFGSGTNLAAAWPFALLLAGI
jgi:hypothetical protein